MSTKVTNAIAFQICWFGSILAAANGMPWMGPLLIVLWLFWHLNKVSEQPAREGRLIFVAALFGWCADSMMVGAGLISFAPQAEFGFYSPLWMVGLWAGFAATLGHSLSWLRGKWWLALALGAVAGPLAYRGGEALGALNITDDWAFAAVAILYGVVTPLMLGFTALPDSSNNLLATPARVRSTS